MEYLKGLNQALAYVEEHLEEDINYKAIYKIARMPKSTFQHTFLFATDMSIMEYVRKLRLRNAAEELIETDHKIIDIALKYGYESAAAFSRACRNFCGQSPSEIREQGTYINFPSIHFEISIAEGEMTMNEKTIVRIEEHANEKVVCFDVDCMDPEEAAWGLMSEWCKQHIPDRAARHFLGLAPHGHHQEGEKHQKHLWNL